MRFGLDISQHQQPWEEILRRARFAEDAGFDGAWVFDHFKALYGDPTGPCFEAYTLLAALAASTERVRLGALVTGITYRHPSILATEAVTIDHISNGRLELAVGAAWFEQEHRELGFDFPPARDRARRLEESIEAMRLLMTTDGASYAGEHVTLRDATYRPRPVQRPTPPLWIGAGGEKIMVPLAARHADVWHTFASPSSVAAKARRFDALVEKAGRDPKEVARSTSLSLSQTMGEIRGAIDAYEAAGISYLTVSWPSEGKPRLDEFVEKVMPEYLAR